MFRWKKLAADIDVTPNPLLSGEFSINDDEKIWKFPQVPCLVSLLFLIYINDLPCIIKNWKVSMYADNTSLYHFSKDVTQLNGAVNEDLGKLDRWLKGNKLSLNVTKTHSMLITTKHKKNHLEISSQTFQPSIHETNVEVASNTKYLGVQIDEHPSWKEHISLACNWLL